MPTYDFTIRVSGITPQKATAIRDRLVARLGDDAVTVDNVAMAAQTTEYRVRGVDTSDRSVFTELVDAQDQSAAVAQCETSSRVVVSAEPTRP